MAWMRLPTRPRRRRFEGWGEALVDASLLGVPIRRADGTEVREFRSQTRWGRLLHGRREDEAVEPIEVRELLRESHRRSYGSPWITGRVFADALLAREIPPDSRLLDIGCGSGRVGRWLVEALDPGGYYGVDAHLRSLVAFSAYELRLAGLLHKQPSLMVDPDFRFDAFGQRFDVAVDMAVSWHFPLDRVEVAYRRLRDVVTPDARILVQGHDPDRRAERIAQLGFRLEDETPIEWPEWIGRAAHKRKQILRTFRPS